MRLAIIGAGNVGGTLGTAWAQKAGHEIFFGVRNPTSDQTQALVQRLDGRAQAGTPAQAAAFAEFIVLTTPWNAAETAIRSMGDLSGKIILDATNPLAAGPDGLSLEIGHSILDLSFRLESIRRRSEKRSYVTSPGPAADWVWS
jgi:8-hydroxy-5-deazaflavin:NADPH oxidoreductase